MALAMWAPTWQVGASGLRRCGCAYLASAMTIDDGESLNRIQEALLAAADSEARSEAAQRLAVWLNPVSGSPSSPLETRAFLDSFGPSLMPRTSMLQGVAAGMNVLAARAVMSVVEGTVSRVLPPSASLPWQLGARAATAGIGVVLGRTPEDDDETLYRAGARSAGNILRVASIGGAVYDLGSYLRVRYPARRAGRPAAVSALALAGVAYWASQRIAKRK